MQRYLLGRVTTDHRLEVDLPEDIPPGVVEIRLETLPDATLAYTEAELQELLHTAQEPMSGAEVVAWLQSEPSGWLDYGITDSAPWVQDLRRRLLAL